MALGGGCMRNAFTRARVLRSLPLAGAVAVTLLVLLPLGGLIAGALHPPPTPFHTGPATFAALIQRSGVWRLFASTLGLGAVVSLAALPSGTWLAWVEQRARYPGVRALGILTLLPLALPSYLVASTIRDTVGPGGLVGRSLGLGVFRGFWPAALVLTVITIPYVQLLVSAALARMSAAEEEAARSLGASGWRTFRTVVLPRLRPTLAFSLLLTALYVISDFGAVAVLDCQVLTWRLYQAADHQQLGQAVVLGFAVLGATVPLLVGARLIHGVLPGASTVSNPRPPARRTLTPAALALAYLMQAAVIGLGVALPILTLLVWVRDGIRYDETFASLWVPLRDTAAAAGVGALFTVALALLPAWIGARRGPRLSWAIEQGTYLTSALPGVLLAFGLMLAALFVSRGLGRGSGVYQTLTGSGVLLLLGYAMRFLAEAYASLKTAVLHLDPRQEASARTLGVSRGKWLRRIALPAVAPGTAAAFVLVLLALIKELPVTLLLGGAMGLRTLSFRVYDRYQEAFLHDAGLAGLLMVAVACSVVAISLRWRQYV